MVVDALGLPLAFELSEGQRHDSQPAPTLIERCSPSTLLGDKAYDSNVIRACLDALKCVACIPSNSSRSEKLPYAKELDKARAEVECTFGLMKHARRFATRYEKTLRNYASMVALGCCVCWLRI
jgi:transposase